MSSSDSDSSMETTDHEGEAGGVGEAGAVDEPMRGSSAEESSEEGSSDGAGDHMEAQQPPPDAAMPADESSLDSSQPDADPEHSEGESQQQQAEKEAAGAPAKSSSSSPASSEADSANDAEAPPPNSRVDENVNAPDYQQQEEVEEDSTQAPAAENPEDNSGQQQHHQVIPDISSNEEDEEEEEEGEKEAPDRDRSRSKSKTIKTESSGDGSVEREFTADDIVGPRLYSDPEEEKEDEDAQPTIIELEMARVHADLGEEGPLFVKFPNFLSVDTKPFDPDTYEDEAENEDELLDEEGRARLKLKIENTVRWRVRKDQEGNDVRESNAKIVRWSDGTMSLYLGNEIFDVEKQKIMDFNHLYIRQGAGLQAQAVFAEKLVFRPHSTETLTHRKVTLGMADKTSRTQKMKVIAEVGENPESQKLGLIKVEEEKLRAAARREAHQRRVRDRPRVSGLSSGFLEGYDSDEGGESLAAIKRRYQYGMGPDSSYQSYRPSSESEEDTQAIERAKSAADTKIYSDEESDVEMESSSHSHHKQQKQQKKKIIIDEDEEEAGGGGENARESEDED